MEQYINKIINADCMDILKKLPDKCIDAIICDLPYSMTACEWDCLIPFDKLWEQYKRIRKDNTPIVLFGSQPFTTMLIASNIKEFKYEWIWQKESGTGFLNAKRMPLRNFEEILVFYNQQPTYNPQMREGKAYTCKKGSLSNNYASSDKIVITENKGERFPLSILKFNRDREKLHPTQKPVALIEYLIKTYSNEGDLILDNCSGGGTTAIACHNLKRRFICIEKDYDYWKASVERLENAQAQLRLF